MVSPRQLGGSLLARLVARVLVAALVFALLPPRAEASIPSAGVTVTGARPLEDLAPNSPATSPRLVRLCLVAIAVADPIWLTESAFGELLAHTGTDTQPYAFAGEPYDPNTAFEYHRARWMDPKVGRFAAVDPWEGRQADPTTLHKYLYAVAGPVNNTDPTGEFTIGQAAAVGAIVGILATNALVQPKTVQEAVRATAAGAVVGSLVGTGIGSDAAGPVAVGGATAATGVGAGGLRLFERLTVGIRATQEYLDPGRVEQLKQAMLRNEFRFQSLEGRIGNRRTKTTFPDATYTETTYDELSRRTSEKDQAGKVTQFQ